MKFKQATKEPKVYDYYTLKEIKNNNYQSFGDKLKKIILKPFTIVTGVMLGLISIIAVPIILMIGALSLNRNYR